MDFGRLVVGDPGQVYTVVGGVDLDCGGEENGELDGPDMTREADGTYIYPMHWQSVV